MNIDTADALEALKHYGIQVAAGKADHTGTSIVVAGEVDDVEGRTIALRSGPHAIRRMVPLGEAGAEVLASHLQGAHHRLASESARRLLEHLLLRCSAMFEDTEIDTFRLDIRLHEHSYAVVDAAMTAPSPLHLKKRLDPHAHDRKGSQYRPAGRQ
jgi:hypothetical protein